MMLSGIKIVGQAEVRKREAAERKKGHGHKEKKRRRKQTLDTDSDQSDDSEIAVDTTSKSLNMLRISDVDTVRLSRQIYHLT